jgi:hypothetical protein
MVMTAEACSITHKKTSGRLNGMILSSVHGPELDWRFSGLLLEKFVEILWIFEAQGVGYFTHGFIGA